MEQRNGEGQLLLPPKRNLAHQLVAGMFEPDAAQQRVHSLGNLAVSQPIDAAVQRDVLPYRQIVVQGKTLAHVSDAAPYRFGLGRHIVPGDHRRSCRGLEQADEHAYRSRLPRAVGAKESEDLALFHLESDGVNGCEVAKSSGESSRVDRDVAHMASPCAMYQMKASSIPAGVAEI